MKRRNHHKPDPEGESPFKTRREFFRQGACAALGITGMVNVLSHLRMIATAMGSEGSDSGGPGDYKALVCVFLAGGNDANNMIVPRGAAEYSAYAAARGVLAIPQEDLLAINPGTYSDGKQYGLHPNLAPLHDLFESGNKLALLANVGTLVQPTTQADYAAGASLPPQLFSHSDQQLQWQSSVPDKPFQTGWGGRMADLLEAWNADLGAQISMSISIAGTNSFQVGLNTVPYQVTTNGSISFAGFGPSSDPYSSALNPDGTYRNTNAGYRLKALHDLTGITPDGMGYDDQLFMKAYAGKVQSAYANDLLLSAALDGVSIATPFPTSSLGSQLKMAAQLIAARDSLCQSRQIIFVQATGYDTHADQISSHGNLMAELGESLRAFYDATVELGVQDNVTAFTMSDFARTYTPNGSAATAGSDHAWGSHSLVLGGAVNGGDLYGEMPDLTVNGPDDVNANNGRGRWIPSTAVDEYAATLARWFGVSAEQMPIVFPNLDRFPTAGSGLGFL